MNIVLDDGLILDTDYRTALTPLLPSETAPLKLNAATSKTDGTPNLDEGFVFLTSLPVDILHYHAQFFKNQCNAPQWFFILLNQNDQGMMDLRNAAIKYNLKNCSIFHAKDCTDLKMIVSKIASTAQIIRGKALFLSKHERRWITELAKQLYGSDEIRFVIMNSASMVETDAEYLLLCGEKACDFCGLRTPCSMEPYFVFQIREELQQYLNPDSLITTLSQNYNMTAERVKSRLYFINVESERWLSSPDRRAGKDAVSAGILLWDRFGLPVSRKEYQKENIETAISEFHANLMKIKELVSSEPVLGGRENV